MTTPTDDEFTQLVDADIPRVDLVDKAANGMRFILAKRQDDGSAGLLDPDFVRDLIGKTSGPELSAPAGETVTMSGSPAAIARLIHEAAVRQVTKAPNETPDDRAADSSLKEVSKMADDEATDDLDPTVVLADPSDGAPGIPTDPGSPAWEAIDAATARKWTAILARARTALGVLSDREMMEAASADPDDYDNALDLDDAACAIDYAISVLAPFAVNEQVEADYADDMAAVGKALAELDTGQLDTIEALAHVAKAGRVLSAANEQAIRDAVTQLQKVLATLPAAPRPSR